MYTEVGNFQGHFRWKYELKSVHSHVEGYIRTHELFRLVHDQNSTFRYGDQQYLKNRYALVTFATVYPMHKNTYFDHKTLLYAHFGPTIWQTGSDVPVTTVKVRGSLTSAVRHILQWYTRRTTGSCHHNGFVTAPTRFRIIDSDKTPILTQNLR